MLRPGRLLPAAAVVAAVLAATAAPAGPAQPARLPACAARSIAPAVDTNGATGTVLIYVGLRNRSRHACIARGHAALALRDAKTHRLLHIYGNPYRKTVRAHLHAGKNNIVTLQWTNYCGPGRPLLLVASFGTRRAAERDSYPGARCELPDVPSQLRLFRRTR